MDQQPSWIGRTLSGRYKIEGMLGQGGMSAVYKAMDPNLKRVVAIKLIHPHLSVDPSFVSRFESEASAVASLRHQNIVQVYDFNNDNGVYYIVLEFIPGETLQDRLKRLADNGRQLSIEDALKITMNISDAVGYAHQRGMVHRDIKPANIMLDTQGQAILMDFGIVKILGGDSHTSTGAVVGTARYMSPEIIRGEVADHRADIYSLGVALYEMLSGRPPFVADSAMTLMMMHLNDPIPNLRKFRDDVPAGLTEIIEKCLAKDRNDRYQSTAQLSADLRRALAYIGAQQTSIHVPAATKSQPAASQPNPQPAADMRKPAATSATYSQSVAPVPTPTNVTYPPMNASTNSRRPFWVAGVLVVGLFCLGALLIVGRQVFVNRAKAQRQSNNQTQTALASAVTIPATDAPVVVPLATETSAPTETALPTLSPTLDGPYVVITGIKVEGNLYVVDYEVHNLDDSMHVHMFFNNVPPEQAGSPGRGPWKLTWNTYGNPPFTQYGIANRPADATQMCSLVAHSNHTVILGSGNCVDLP